MSLLVIYSSIVLLRLLLGVVFVAGIWRVSTSQEATFRVVDRAMRDRLLSVPRPASLSFSSGALFLLHLPL
ncbi:unnamed protein product [Brassica rapa]|uniref:Uncharacterized protein n=1 Tax=Brassica campestris TaxID=3711 RepID=A0A3P6BVD2_BRACM|nr:unnamed protein product [Brassica rapa]VDD01121.1 unnamed protein product [Brassica rapa]